MVAILSLALFYKFLDKPMHAAPLNILAETYSISLLAMFNNRIRIIGGRDSTDDGSELRISFQRTTGFGNDSHVIKTVPGGVQVQQDVYVHSETPVIVLSDIEQVMFLLHTTFF